jgi:outer membrane protein OmpA-like peptidoglycan-associated protein
VVEQVVENLDTYYPVTQAEIRFRAGQSALSAQAKAALDQIAGPAKEGRGYVVEVHGFAPGQGRAGTERSQALAQAVARYLVIEHEVPVHRIYVMGLGNTAVAGEDGRSRRATGGGRVEVNLLKNSLGELQAQDVAGGMARAQSR